ncbi:hypothetical protein ABZ330_21675 [Streptomyces sp. NPDC006172]|uniref:hypothetical protein n=1 Tax=Streptomyces sp. NPDC006172 TaxID=3154470 RepID=UPI0033E1AF12
MSGVPEVDSPHDNFQFTIAAVYKAWTSGRSDEETAMAAISDALTELREALEGEQR